MSARDSRQFAPTLTAESRTVEGPKFELLAPAPGLWREAPAPGTLVRPGDRIGAIEILERVHELIAPEGVVGAVVQAEVTGERLARPPVDYGAVLLVLDPEALGAGLAESVAAGASGASADGSAALRAPSSGRFYARPSPDKPPFVREGEVIQRGQTVGLLEVMKTFTRINYDDPKLPAPAKVVAVVAKDQDDLGSGDVILQVEAAEGDEG